MESVESTIEVYSYEMVMALILYSVFGVLSEYVLLADVLRHSNIFESLSAENEYPSVYVDAFDGTYPSSS